MSRRRKKLTAVSLSAWVDGERLFALLFHLLCRRSAGRRAKLPSPDNSTHTRRPSVTGNKLSSLIIFRSKTADAAAVKTSAAAAGAVAAVVAAEQEMGHNNRSRLTNSRARSAARSPTTCSFAGSAVRGVVLTETADRNWGAACHQVVI